MYRTTLFPGKKNVFHGSEIEYNQTGIYWKKSPVNNEPFIRIFHSDCRQLQ